MMRNTVLAINKDSASRSRREELHIKPERVKPIVAAMAEPTSRCATACTRSYSPHPEPRGRPQRRHPAVRQQMLAAANGDKDQMWTRSSTLRCGSPPAEQALRPDVLAAFIEDDNGLAELLQNEVSDASRLRNGIQYFTGVVYILAAAGIEKVFLMIDQLRTSARRARCPPPSAGVRSGGSATCWRWSRSPRVCICRSRSTKRAAQNLEQDWLGNRLPSFDTSPSNAAAVVVLRGLSNNDQVEEAAEGVDGAGPQRARRPVAHQARSPRTCSRSCCRSPRGRAGILLHRANELLFAGASAQVGEIDGAFAQQHFSGNGHLSVVHAGDGDAAEADYDELLA